MYFELTILRVDNGFIASFWEGESPEMEAVKTQIVFEEGDGEHADIECFQRLLYYITEHYGLQGTKHDKRRIRITTGADDDCT
jgi:hypothetical protein